LEPLLTAFAAALTGGWADKSQRVAALLRARSGAGMLVAALLLAAAVNSLVSALAGSLLRRELTSTAAALLLAIALAFAGIAGLIGEAPKPPKGRGGGFLAALVALLGAGWGDKTQYVVAALAAYYDSLLPVAAAAFAGTVAVTLPAAMGGEAFVRAAPMKALRFLFAALFLVAAAVVAVNALRLV
jgi:putative Ca2+/H+ antiporter (TMEM165/GDT1 family)